MKKLLQIKCVGTHGGAGMGEYIGRTAKEHGWESYIAYARIMLPTENKFIRIGNKWDVFEHILETRLFDNHGFASRRATKKLIKQIEQIKPDVIHLHNIHGYYINIDILFKFLLRSKIPVVWTMHDCWMFTGHCSHFVSVGCNKWKSHCGKCPLYNYYPASWFVDRSYTNYEKKRALFTSLEKLWLVPVSKWIADFLPDSFMSKYPVKLIYNGVDVKIFKPLSVKESDDTRRKLNLEGKFVVLGVAHTWSATKGLNDFIEVSRKVESDFVFVLVGLSEDQIKILPSNIIGIKRTSNINELVELYSVADVFWNPTYIDTFPTTTLEAMACGTPCVVYKTGGTPEAITIGTGFVVDQGDIPGSLDAFYKIKGNGKAKYTELCRQNVLERFNKDIQFEEYIKLYESIS